LKACPFLCIIYIYKKQKDASAPLMAMGHLSLQTFIRLGLFGMVEARII